MVSYISVSPNLFVLIIVTLPLLISSFPEQGRWTFKIGSQNNTWAVYKSLFENSTIIVDIKCKGAETETKDVSITWVLRETKCWDEYSQLEYLSTTDRALVWTRYLEFPEATISDYPPPRRFSPVQPITHRCDSSISLPQYHLLPAEGNETSSLAVGHAPIGTGNVSHVRHEQDTLLTIPADGIYLLIINIQGPDAYDFIAGVTVSMKSPHGYLSAADWPLLTFYGGMCAMYVAYGIAWLILSFQRWRDLLRIQFWIGGVIFLGMMEMAVFYAEYQSINSTGVSVAGAVLFAELVSATKRTLARLLIVIVSIGFGIVKPRLGTTLHKLIVVGGLYFILASMECSLRVIHPVNGPSNRAVMAGIGLSLMDGFLCYWIFQSLLATTRQLRLRRNVVKLSLYRNFTNTLIFSVIASVCFMLWSIKVIKTPMCLENWRNIWIDEAFWHVQFSIILLAIMILWRPTNNNQRYAFSPLSDGMDDEEEEDLVINEAFAAGMKLRPKQHVSEKAKKYRNQTADEDLKWVDQNIPNDFGEGDLPAMDSEEELVTSKFELSKMQ